ncbi:hypothetical protein L3X38_027147 [Prunus dulcis]|uniref:Integrase catalytic domain-containing protein n=1 Tax=Prunus dulcis TaxID=3755 RepID=A0AAD4VPN6_PRUDU|nr:hypothetical protein L3X38_027147 [Prunus dulcis]
MAKDASMTAYLQHARHLLATFHAHTIRQVPRSENSHADALARLASALEQGMGRHIHIEFLAQPSTQAPLICTIDHSPTWMDPILQFFLPYLRCLTPEEGHYVLREIHEGICGNHSGARSVAHKAIRQGYFWPSLHIDAQANIPQLPAEPLTAMVSPWPFAQWGLDLIGPMPEGKGQVKYAVVAVDYFTKWAEAEALATITVARIESFVWQNIVCRFGIPNSIVTDNGRQFDNAKFKQFCSNLKIRLCFVYASTSCPASCSATCCDALPKLLTLPSCHAKNTSCRSNLPQLLNSPCRSLSTPARALTTRQHPLHPCRSASDQPNLLGQHSNTPSCLQLFLPAERHTPRPLRTVSCLNLSSKLPFGTPAQFQLQIAVQNQDKT